MVPLDTGAKTGSDTWNSIEINHFATRKPAATFVSCTKVQLKNCKYSGFRRFGGLNLEVPIFSEVKRKYRGDEKLIKLRKTFCLIVMYVFAQFFLVLCHRLRVKKVLLERGL